MENSPPLEMNENRALFSLFLAIFIDLLGFGIIIPILPFLVLEDLKSTPEQLGYILAIYSLVQFIFSPLWGRISDKIGRRPVLLIGIFGSSISFFLFGISVQLWELYLARGLAGFFTAASLPTARAYIADISTGEKRTVRMALIGVAFGLGFTLGPVIGGLLSPFTVPGFTQYKYAAPSFFAVGLSLVNFLLGYFDLPETLGAKRIMVSKELYPTSSERNTVFSRYKKIVSYEQIILIMLLFFSSTLFFSEFESMFTPFVITIDNTVTPQTIGFLFGFVGVIVIIVQGGLIRVIVKRLTDEKTVQFGLALTMLGFAILAFSNSILTISIGLVPLAIGQALLTPALSSLIADRLPENDLGEGLGLNSGLGSLGRVLGPIFGAYLFTVDNRLPFTMGIIFFGLLLGVAYLQLRPLSTIGRNIVNPDITGF